MIIAIIVDNYTLTLKLNGGGIQAHHVDEYRDAWAAFDPDGTGFVNVKHLSTLIRGLPPPLGLDPRLYPNSVVRDVDISRYVFQLDVSHRCAATRHRLSIEPRARARFLRPCSRHASSDHPLALIRPEWPLNSTLRRALAICPHARVRAFAGAGAPRPSDVAAEPPVSRATGESAEGCAL